MASGRDEVQALIDAVDATEIVYEVRSGSGALHCRVSCPVAPEDSFADGFSHTPTRAANSAAVFGLP